MWANDMLFFLDKNKLFFKKIHAEMSKILLGYNWDYFSQSKLVCTLGNAKSCNTNIESIISD